MSDPAEADGLRAQLAMAEHLTRTFADELEQMRTELRISKTIRDATRSECNRLIEENRMSRSVVESAIAFWRRDAGSDKQLINVVAAYLADHASR